ncbi:MAG: shikimate kinase [Oscillospiraceae bacterium]
MEAIFLCGFMGCGKSSVGRKLSQSLKSQFTDLDRYIVEREGRTIPEIFAENGEEYFRKIERLSLQEVSQNGGVIATGGGALLNAETADFAKNFGKICFIDVTFEVCYRRICGDENRPLVQKNSKRELLSLFKMRRVLYRQNSDFSVNGNARVQDIVKKIVAKLPLDVVE